MRIKKYLLSLFSFMAFLCSAQTLSVSGTTFCSGTTGTMTVTGADTYTWVRAYDNATLSTTDQLLLTPGYSEVYTVFGTDLLSNTVVSLTFSTQVDFGWLSIGPNTPIICSGASITLYASGATVPSYSWSTGATTPYATLSPTTTTTYTLYGSNACGALAMPFSVMVNPSPTISFTGPSYICPGQTYSWVASGGSAYLFSGLANYISTDGTLINGYSFLPNNINYIMVTGYSPSGFCGTSTSIPVYMLPAPDNVITSSTGLTSLCQGNMLTLSVAPGAATYSWNTGSSSYSTAVAPTVTTLYSVVITGTNGCTNSNSYSLPVFLNPPATNPVAASYTSCPNGYPGILLNQPYTPGITYSVNAVNYDQGIGYFNPPASGNYTIFAENACGVSSSTFDVQFLPAPSLSILAPDSACQNSVITYSVLSNYPFYFSTFNNSPTGTLTVSSSLTLAASATSTNGCFALVVKQVKMLPAPVLNILPSVPSVCLGSPVTLTLNGTAATYTWSTGAINSPLPLNPVSGTLISVAATASNGCMASASRSVSVRPLPSFAASASPTAACIGSGSTIFCFANGAPYTYSWSNGYAGDTQSVVPGATTVYTVTATDPYSCQDTRTVSLVINPLPPVSFTQSQYSVCHGVLAALSATGAPYIYFPQGVASGTTMYISNPLVNGVYTVTGYDANLCSATATTYLYVYPAATVNIAYSSYSICSGSSLTLTASGAQSYTWSTGSLVNPLVLTPSASSLYSVTGTNANGCKDGDILSITVFPTPVPAIVASSTAVCPGGTATLTAMSANSYTWSTGSLLNSIYVSPPATTVYTVTAADFNSCRGTQTITLVVAPFPTVSVAGGTICEGQSFTLTPSGANVYTYNNSNGPVVTPSVGTSVYYISGMNSSGCSSTSQAAAYITVNPAPVISAAGGSICAGQSFTIIPSGSAGGYTFSSGSSVVSPVLNTSYSVSGVGANGCKSTLPALVNVTVSQLPVISAPGGTICAGWSFTIFPTGAATYTFNSGTNVVSPATTTAYLISGTSVAGCVNTLPGVVTVSVKPSPAITVNSGTVCAGKSFTIVPSGAITYTFSGGSAVVSPTISASYSVTGTGSNSCVNNPPAISSITVVHVPLVASSTRSVVCIGESATLTSSGALTYTWSNGGTANSLSVTPTVNVTYTVSGTAANGCKNSVVITQSVNACTDLKEAVADGVPARIYPNPGTGLFQIQLDGVWRDCGLALLDATGRLILSRKLDPSNTALDLQSYASGLYYVKITSGKAVTVFKIVKQD